MKKIRTRGGGQLEHLADWIAAVGAEELTDPLHAAVALAEPLTKRRRDHTNAERGIAFDSVSLFFIHLDGMNEYPVKVNI